MGTPTPILHESRFESLGDTSGTLFDSATSQLVALGGAQANCHGLLRGELHVLSSLPPTLAQGLFGEPKAFTVLIRLTSVSGLHGIAVKVMVGLEGQDFVLAHIPTKAEKVPKLQQVVTAMAKGAERVMERVGRESTALKSTPHQAENHILGETFRCPVPVLHGPYMARVSLVPISPELILLKDVKLPLLDKPDALRDAVVDFFVSNGAEWELRVQLCTAEQDMLTLDQGMAWPEERSPCVAVARIAAPPQVAWSAAALNESLSFNPWRGLAEHRPLWPEPDSS